jgi:hypothetical protein
MGDIDFRIDGVEVAAFAATPLLLFKLRVSTTGDYTEIANINLQCQVQIETSRRRYQPGEQQALQELFGHGDRWGQTLRTLLWTHTSVAMPPFTGERCIDLPVPCSFDFNVAATKYFEALEQGGIALSFQFTGSVFYREDGYLQVTQIPWDKDAAFSLPVEVWRDLMNRYYPNSAWLNMRRDSFERLRDYKRRHALPSWEEALDHALARASGEAVEAAHPAGSGPRPANVDEVQP